MTKTSNLNLITKKICELFEYTIPGEWGIEGDPENDIPVLRSTNFTNEGRIDYSNLAFRKIDPKRLALRLVNKGTILIEKSGGSPSQPAGRVVYCDEDFNGSASNFIEIAKTNNLFCPKYVFFLLHHLYQIGLVLKYQQQTTGIINFKLEQYKNEEVLLPRDRKEQTQIAAILSTIDRAIEQTEAIIAKQQRIKTGLMQDLLTKGIDENGNVRSEETHEFKDSPLGRIPVEWEVQTLESIVDEPITYGIVQAGSHIAGGIPYIRTGDMAGDSFELDKLLRTSPKIAKSYKRSEVYAGDIVFALRATVGKVLSVPQELSGSNLTQGTAKISPMADIDETFLLWALRASIVAHQIQVVQKGTTFSEITLGELCKLRIVLPKKREEQSIIGFQLQTRQESIQLMKTLLAKHKEAKTGLMQDLLTGNVRVTALLNDPKTAQV